MTGQLPVALEVGGRLLPINADFRNVLTIFEALCDCELSDREKAYVCLCRLYTVPVPNDAAEEAIKKAYWFCDGGDMPKTEPEAVRTVDWKHDEQIIFPAVSKTVGVVDIRVLPFMHWWTFLGSFGEIGEGLFSSVMNIRHKKAKGKRLEKYEEEFYSRNKELIRLRSPEEQTAIGETEAFLETII